MSPSVKETGYPEGGFTGVSSRLDVTGELERLETAAINAVQEEGGNNVSMEFAGVIFDLRNNGWGKVIAFIHPLMRRELSKEIEGGIYVFGGLDFDNLYKARLLSKGEYQSLEVDWGNDDRKVEYQVDTPREITSKINLIHNSGDTNVFSGVVLFPEKLKGKSVKEKLSSLFNDFDYKLLLEGLDNASGVSSKIDL